MVSMCISLVSDVEHLCMQKYLAKFFAHFELGGVQVFFFFFAVVAVFLCIFWILTSLLWYITFQYLPPFCGL